jgi:hypothetical protein
MTENIPTTYISAYLGKDTYFYNSKEVSLYEYYILTNESNHTSYCFDVIIDKLVKFLSLRMKTKVEKFI